MAGCSRALSDPGGDGPTGLTASADGSTPDPGQAASPSPSGEDDAPVRIASGGETIAPYVHWTWSETWTERGWLSADAFPLSDTLPEIAEELPTIRYGDDISLQCEDGVSFTGLSIYDAAFKRIHHNADLSSLEALQPGTYYLGIGVVARGDYIESEDEYESDGYDCAVRLVVQ